MNNWFSVGEEVSITSVSNPQYNGKTFFITRILDAHDVYIDRLNGSRYHMTEGPGFIMDECLEDRTEKDGREIVFSPSALRKKYPPSSEGFQSLMSKIKDNVLENVD